MVKVSTSLLTFALAAMASALVLPTEYQRRSELDSNLYTREFVDNVETPFRREDLEEFYERDFDDLESREPFGLFKVAKAGIKFGMKAAKNKKVQHVAAGVFENLF